MTLLKSEVKDVLCYTLVLQVLMPNKRYNGQKLHREVSVNTAAIANSTLPKTPSTTPVKCSTTKITDTSKRMIRSIHPMFFFIS